MLCYRDMTFCTFYEDCKQAEKCPRPLTPEVIKQAAEWWGRDDAPIAQFVDKPNCWVSSEPAGSMKYVGDE